MKAFLAKQKHEVAGVLRGWDRVIMQGTFRQFAHADGLVVILTILGVLMKDFGAWTKAVTERIWESVESRAAQLGVPVTYLRSPKESKEELAREIATKRKLTRGLISLFSVVEPGRSFRARGNHETKKLDLVSENRMAKHYYAYFLDDLFGFCHVRIHTWIPFSVRVYFNGREFLAKAMDRLGIRYQRKDNCFTWIEDVKRAQKLLDGLQKLEWPKVLDHLVRRIHPLHGRLFKTIEMNCYWTVMEAEWATDIMFKSPDYLPNWYSALTRHAMLVMGCEDVLRFFDRKIPSPASEVSTNLRKYRDGVRVKHRLNKNWVKMYDKAPNLLRIEVTINYTRDFWAYRRSERDPKGDKRWLPLRKGIADFARLARICDNIVNRYANRLAQVNVSDPETVSHVVERITHPAKSKSGRRVRALRPLDPKDTTLFQAIANAAFTIQGFRCRDIVALLFPSAPASGPEHKRLTSSVSRHLAILRAHKLIQKVPHSHRYQLTAAGSRVVSATLLVRETPMSALHKAVA